MRHRALFLGLIVAGSVTPTVAAPCIDLSAKPSATHPAKQEKGLINRAERAMGVTSPGAEVTADQNICPLTTGQKFHVWVQKSYSPVNFAAAALDAAIWQATQPRADGGYGQGWDAYGSRFGASLADAETSRFFQVFLLPSLLREDPRYFRESRGPVGRRLGYAMSRVLVARTDSGTHRFNFSTVLGAFAAAALTNTYYPDADRTAPRTMRAAGLNLATAAGWNTLYEFGPDILRRIAGRKKTTGSAPPNTD